MAKKHEAIVEHDNKGMAVTNDMIIGEVAKNFPETIEVMLKHGLHCIGCSANPLETIEQGSTGHGMEGAEMQEMLWEMNKVIEEARKNPAIEEDKHLPKEITLTENAAVKVKDILKRNSKEGHALRFASVRGGCSGWRYEMSFDDTATDKDLTFEQHGVKVFVDKDSIKRVGGSIIDYAESLEESGFKITNPSAEKSCGCGKSFG